MVDIFDIMLQIVPKLSIFGPSSWKILFHCLLLGLVKDFYQHIIIRLLYVPQFGQWMLTMFFYSGHIGIISSINFYLILNFGKIHFSIFVDLFNNIEDVLNENMAIHEFWVAFFSFEYILDLGYYRIFQCSWGIHQWVWCNLITLDCGMDFKSLLFYSFNF